MAKKDQRKGYSPTQWAAILVVVVMAFSTIAFSFLSGSKGPSQEPPGPPSNQQNTTPMNFKAELNTKVVELLPSFKLFASSSQPDIDKIDALIRGNRGVIQVTSSFRQDPSKPGELIYAADIRYAKDQISLQQLIEGITNNSTGILSNIVVFPSALFEVPKKVVFQNADLNLSREYLFLDQLKPGLVMQTTQAGDIVQAEMDATFTGNTLSNLNLYELSNPTAKPITRLATRPLEVLSLEPFLVFGSDTNFSDALMPSLLEQSLAGIPDTNELQVKVFPAGALSFEIDAPIDLNAFESFFNQLPVVSNAQTISNQQPYRFIAQVKTIEDYNTAIFSIRGELASLSVPNQKIFFDAFSVSVQGRMGLTPAGEADADRIANSIQARLAAKLSTLDIYQPGTVKADSIQESMTDPKSKSYPIESGKIRVLFFPGNKKGDQVFIGLQYQTIRDKVISATGVQVIPPQVK